MLTGNAALHLKRIGLGTLTIFCAVTFGVLQSLDVVKLLGYLRSNAHLQQIMWSCLVINSVFFISLWIASFFFSFIWSLCEGIVWRGNGVAVAMIIESVNNEGNYTLVAGKEMSLMGKVWVSFFDVMWVLPVYAITQALGMRWYSALYTEAYLEKKHRTSSASGVRWDAREYNRESDISSPTTSHGGDELFSFRNAVMSVSEIMFKALVTAVYALVSVVIEAVVPSPVGHIVAFMMNSWLYAFYVFDYRLSSQYVFDRKAKRPTRVNLSTTLKLFEAHWAYFLGFGATQSVITATLRSSWLAFSWFSIASVTSVLFGAHIVISVEATPAPRSPFSVMMFTPFFAICGVVLRRILNAFF